MTRAQSSSAKMITVFGIALTSEKAPFDAQRISAQAGAIGAVVKRELPGAKQPKTRRQSFAEKKKKQKKAPLEPSNTAFLGDVENDAWEFKSTIAYWSTVMGIEGVILFTIGCVMGFPGMTPADKPWVAKAWCDWTFFIGGCCFTLANYLCFFQVINKHNSHSGHHPIRFLSWEDGETDGGHIATAMNFVGAILFNINVGEMFGWPSTEGMTRYNINYIGIGALGSLLFTMASFIQGEYNEWRKPRLDAAVLLSHFNFWGSLLFLIGYLVDINKFAKNLAAEGNDFLLFWGVDVGFLVGTLFFLFSSCTDLVLWQSERFGLGFATGLKNNSHLRANFTQLLTITVITANICIAWVRLSFLYVRPESYLARGGSQWSIWEKMLAYHGLLLMMSLIHKAPDGHPWDYFLYTMQFITVYGFVGECVELNIVVLSYQE